MIVSESFLAPRPSNAVEKPDAARLLLSLLPAPSHQSGIGLVVRNATACLTALLADMPALRTPHLLQSISQLSDLSGATPCVASPGVLMGVTNEYPAWAWFASASFPTENRLQILVGTHLVIAILKELPIEKGFIEKLRRAIKQHRDEVLTDKQREDLITKLEGQAHQKLEQLLVLNSSSTTSVQLSFNAALITRLSNQMNSHRQKERQAVDGDQTCSRNELKSAVAALHEKAQNGDPDALVILVCLCLGLGHDLGKKTPLISAAQGQGWMAWIDPVKGCMYVDLSLTLSDLGKNACSLHQPSTRLLKRPLPQALANMLRCAHAQNSQLLTLEELCTSKATGRKKLNLKEVHHSATLARLMNSPRTVLLEITGRRDISAYTALAFQLLNKSDLHYVCPRQGEIWQACSSLYEAIGLGAAVDQGDEASGLRIGSRLTPSAKWIKKVFADAENDLHSSIHGRNYSLQSLVSHHNTFARYAGLYMHLVVGARNRRVIEFYASDWPGTTTFGLMKDKPQSATRGRTPIPIPMDLAAQIKFWYAHLAALIKRLVKLQAPGCPLACQLIQKITARQKVPLHFLLNETGAPVPLTSDFLFMGSASELNRDFGRHFLPDMLLDAGVPFDDIQDWLRHYAPGTSTHELHSTRAMHQGIERLISGIDRVLLELGIRPKAGLIRKI